ncbi:tetratricopeptide repeat protein, partial [Nostoc sp. NIES-2111]
LAADVEGYSRLMGEDEVGTLRRLAALRRVVDARISERGGRIANTAGDSVLAEFRTITDAVLCATEAQSLLATEQQDVAPHKQIKFRIGINAGDVLVRGGDIFGDGVNVAARIQSLAPPGGVAVSRTVRDQVRDRLPLVFDDIGLQAVKNINRALRVFVVRGVSDRGEAGKRLDLPSKPSLAVMPFENLSGDLAQERLADGIADEITAALSRVRSLFIVSRSSTQVYRARPADPHQIGRELGVQYLLEGSWKQAADRVRITAQLIDAPTGNPIWADRYDGALSDIFALQDRITEGVAGAIQPSILTAEIERARRKRPENLLAYDYVLRAFPMVWSIDKAQNEEAQRLLVKSIDLDGSYPLALSLLAWCHAQQAVYNWSDEPDQERQTAIRLAQHAASISRDDPMVLAILGAAHTVSRDFASAAAQLERAVTIDPNSAWAWNRMAWLNANQDRADLAIEQFERAIRLSPLDPLIYMCHLGIATAHFTAGRDEETVSFGRRCLSEQPSATWCYRVLVPALVFCGRVEEARAGLRLLMDDYPGITVTKVRAALPFTPSTLARVLDGLRQAGLPE